MLIQLAGPPSMGMDILGSAKAAVKLANETAQKIYPVGHVHTWPDGTQSVMGPQGWIRAADINSGAVPMPAAAPAGPGAAPGAPGMAAAGMAGPTTIGGLTRPALVWLAIGALLLVGGGIYFARR